MILILCPDENSYHLKSRERASSHVSFYVGTKKWDILIDSLCVKVHLIWATRIAMAEVSSLPHILILAPGLQNPVIQCCSNELYVLGILFRRYGK